MSMTHQITAVWDEQLWKQAEQVYHEAFPEHGRKNRAIVKRMFERKIPVLHTWHDGSSVVAMAISAIHPNAKVLILDYIAVRQDQRGKGLGRACIRDIRDWAENEIGCRGIVIEVEAEVTKENTARIHFWEAVGFRMTDYVHTYIWVPETYRAMYMSFDNSQQWDDGKQLFTYITDYHERAYTGRG